MIYDPAGGLTYMPRRTVKSHPVLLHISIRMIETFADLAEPYACHTSCASPPTSVSEKTHLEIATTVGIRTIRHPSM